jgi:mRNA-degrading endonuclease RelE of RelBE toxin-antitoxin system
MAPTYTIEFSERAAAELAEARAFEQRMIVAAIRVLRHQAEVPTQNRKRLRAPLDELPEASWQLRVGKYRVLYEVLGGRTVRVLRVIIKAGTTAESL